MFIRPTNLGHNPSALLSNYTILRPYFSAFLVKNDPLFLQINKNTSYCILDYALPLFFAYVKI